MHDWQKRTATAIQLIALAIPAELATAGVPGSIPSVDISVDFAYFGEPLPDGQVELIVNLSGTVLDQPTVTFLPIGASSPIDTPVVPSDFSMEIPLLLEIDDVPRDPDPEPHTVKRVPPPADLDSPCLLGPPANPPTCTQAPGASCPSINFEKSGQHIAVDTGPCDLKFVTNNAGDVLGRLCICSINFPEWKLNVPERPGAEYRLIFDPLDQLVEFNEQNNSTLLTRSVLDVPSMSPGGILALFLGILVASLGALRRLRQDRAHK